MSSLESDFNENKLSKFSSITSSSTLSTTLFGAGNTIREFAQTPIENIDENGGVHSFQVYKSVNLDSNSIDSCHGMMSNDIDSFQSLTITQDNLKAPYLTLDLSSSTSSLTSNSTTGSASSSPRRICHECPIFLMKTRIKCNIDVELHDIEIQIGQLLNQLPEVSVKFDENHHNWQLFIVKGAITSNLEINIYEDFSSNNDSDKSQYIIEVNKLKGSTDLHHEFFKQIQSSLFPITSCSPGTSVVSSSLSSLSDKDLDNDTLFSIKSIDPINSPYVFSDILGSSNIVSSTELITNLIHLASSGMYESMVVASGLLYDLSLHHSYFDFILTNEATIFNIIISLLSCDIVEVKRNTIFSLTTLSESQLFHGKLISYGIVLNLFPHLSSCMASYDSIDICRTCACVLANVAQSCPKAVLNSIGVNYFQHWYKSAKTIDDRNLQIFVDRIAHALL